MTFISRILGAALLAALIIIVVGLIFLGFTFLLSRGIQWFFKLWGREVGSLFDWAFGPILKKMGFEKRKEGKSNDSRTDSTVN